MSTINIYIPRNPDGTPMTGPVPKGQRARLIRTKGIDIRTYFDAEADGNLHNAIRTLPKAAPLNPRIAPRGWSLRPAVVPVEKVDPEHAASPEVRAGHCGKTFRTQNGYAWHIANVHQAAA